VSDRDELLSAVGQSFDAAARSFDAARRLLLVVIAGDDVEQEIEAAGGCRHPDAVEVTTLGDRGQVFVCPDCGDQFT
jgi:hypothetical protein